MRSGICTPRARVRVTRARIGVRVRVRVGLGQCCTPRGNDDSREDHRGGLG